MSIRTVVTRGYGTFGGVASVVTQGYSTGDPTPPSPGGTPPAMLFTPPARAVFTPRNPAS